MMKNKFLKRYPGKRAFITGGGSGLGRAFALALAADQWTIGITDIKEEGLVETSKLAESAGGKAYMYLFDVSDKHAYKNAFDDFIFKTGGLDLLINNAGVGDGGFFGEYELEHWDWITGVNLMATVYGSHFATPVMKKQGSGHIISIASAAGFANLPNMSMYNTTKAAVISLMETLHAELHGHGVNVSVACPTFFRSNIMQHRKGDKDTVLLADAIVQGAKYLPEDIAVHILTEAGKGKFYILPSIQSKFTFHFKRFFPKFFLRYKAKHFSVNNGREWLIKMLEM